MTSISQPFWDDEEDTLRCCRACLILLSLWSSKLPVSSPHRPPPPPPPGGGPPPPPRRPRPRGEGGDSTKVESGELHPYSYCPVRYCSRTKTVLIPRPSHELLDSWFIFSFMCYYWGLKEWLWNELTQRVEILF